MKRSDISLFWSLPPDTQDWANLQLSGCNRVMLPFWLANTHRDILSRLAATQKRVVLRVEEDRIYDGDAPSTIHDALRAMLDIVAVDALILGCEPENPFNLNYGSHDWGQSWAYSHWRAVTNIRLALASVQGVAIVAPGWTMRSISEDEPVAAGKVTWREITNTAYSRMDGVGCHIYQYGWASVVDELRFKFALKEAQLLFHLPLWIDEVNIARGSQIERMTACIAMAGLLVNRPIGDRVRMFSPFVSSGNGVGYDGGLVMRDPACYRPLGDFMRAEALAA